MQPVIHTALANPIIVTPVAMATAQIAFRALNLGRFHPRNDGSNDPVSGPLRVMDLRYISQLFPESRVVFVVFCQSLHIVPVNRSHAREFLELVHDVTWLIEHPPFNPVLAPLVVNDVLALEIVFRQWSLTLPELAAPQPTMPYPTIADQA